MPASTTPSTGTISPALTRMRSPAPRASHRHALGGAPSVRRSQVADSSRAASRRRFGTPDARAVPDSRASSRNGHEHRHGIEVDLTHAAHRGGCAGQEAGGHADGRGHVHTHRALAQAAPGAGEDRGGGIEDDRERPARSWPSASVATGRHRCVASWVLDRPRVHHDLHHAEHRHGHPHQQPARVRGGPGGRCGTPRIATPYSRCPLRRRARRPRFVAIPASAPPRGALPRWPPPVPHPACWPGRCSISHAQAAQQDTFRRQVTSALPSPSGRTNCWRSSGVS